MNVLLDVVISTQPDKVIPVVHLILHLGHARLPRAVPDALRIEVGAGEEQVADQSVMNLVDHLHVVPCVAEVVADSDVQPLLLRIGIGDLDRPIAGGVHGHRLFQEHLLARLHGRGEMGRTKARRRAEHHDVCAGGDRLLVGVEPHEPAIGRHVRPCVKLVLEV